MPGVSKAQIDHFVADLKEDLVAEVPVIG